MPGRLKDEAAGAWPRRSGVKYKGMKQIIFIAAQIAMLVVLNKLGYIAADALQVPLPGNLLGMLFLLALLANRVVPVQWIDGAASLLVRHLAFFFIPITVGLMGVAGLFIRNGPAILVTLLVSAGLGIWIAGLCVQLLASRIGRDAP
jgi:holin-like protein